MAQVDLLIVVQKIVQLRPKSDFYVGDCPFGRCRQTFVVTPRRSIYFCFTCRKTGHAATFVSEFYGMRLSQAILFLTDPVFLKVVRDRSSRSAI
jgi:DNA primase